MDDTNLGYIKPKELQELLESLQEAGESCPGGCAAEAFPAVVAECFACRVPHIVDMGVDMLPSELAWGCPRVLREALSVGQDPDCRGQVPPSHCFQCSQFNRLEDLVVKEAHPLRNPVCPDCQHTEGQTWARSGVLL